jgi:hypothetical protein
MIIDVISYNGESDLFDIRYNILKDYVDEFIVVEAPTTFSGKQKPLYFKDIKDKYDKVKYHVIDENYSDDEIALAKSSPNTKGASHWCHEFLQKESIKKGITHLNDDDIVFIGDCDEIWNPLKNELPEIVKLYQPIKLKLDVYTYWLNNKSTEVFWGNIVGTYRDIKNSCLNHLRTDSRKTQDLYGWHFTSMAQDLHRKLTDSYTNETYANDWVLNNLDENIKNSKDFLGRSFTYTLDTSQWPEYLKINQHKYKHLIK